MSKRKAGADLRPGGMKGLMKELQIMEKAGFIVDVDEGNAKVWRVSLTTGVLKTHGLGTLIGQLQLWARRVRKPPVIVLELEFADNHPFDPPFVRIVRPRFQQYTGHITVGGSICSKLVTADGWRPDISMESLLRTILEGMNDGEAKIEPSEISAYDYTIEEAVSAYQRVASFHGWATAANVKRLR